MNNSKSDKLDFMLQMVAAECCKLDVEKFDRIDDSNESFTFDFYQKQNQIIKKYKNRLTRKVFGKSAIRVAIAVILVLSIGFVTVMAIEPIREAIFKAIIEWYDDYLTIRYEPIGGETEGDTDRETESASESNSERSDITTEKEMHHTSEIKTEMSTEAVTEVITEVSQYIPESPTTIEVVRKPTYIPDGVVEDIVLQNSAGVYIDYYFEDQIIYTFHQLMVKDGEILLDNKSAVVDSIEVNGNIVTIVKYSEKNETSIVWTDGEYIYQLVSTVTDLDTLIDVVESVQ